MNGLGPVSMGTTLIGCKFEGGVILAADSRTSSFPVVSNKLARKINPVTDRIYMCRAGNAADSQFVGRLIQSYIKDHAIELGGGPTGRLDSDVTATSTISDEVAAADGRKLFSPCVRTVANIARLISYNNRDNLSFALLVGGMDDINGPQLFSIASGGTLFERDYTCAGSGSVYISALLDSTYKTSMDRETALKWITSLVNHAMMRDNASGGVVRYVVLDKTGATEGMIDGADLMKLELSVAA